MPESGSQPYRCGDYIKRLRQALSQSREMEIAEDLRASLEPPCDHQAALLALTDIAAASLQLQYVTPHPLIAMEYVRQTLPLLEDRQRTRLLGSYVDYLMAKPRLGLQMSVQIPLGEPYVADFVEGLLCSLRNHRVFDATFYALRLAAEDEPRLVATLLDLSANEVDRLGHVFIYSSTAARLLEQVAGAERAMLVLAWMEYLSRTARFDMPPPLDEQSSLEELLPRAVERINILGHNIIYAAELRRRLPQMSEARRGHLLGQLRRNIDQSDVVWTLEAYRHAAAGAEGPSPEDPSAALYLSFAAGRLHDAARALAMAWTDPTARAELPGMLIMLFARINTPQPHYLIYPKATFDILDLLDGSSAELAVAQLVKMGTEAAGRHSLRLL